MIFRLAVFEFKRLFATPLAWLTLAVVMFVIGWCFLSRIDIFLQYLPRLRAIDNAPGMTEIIAIGVNHQIAWLLLAVTALFSARCIAEERRSGSLNLALSAPIRTSTFLLGKWFGLLGFLSLIVLLSGLVISTLFLAVSPDQGQILSGLLALFLLMLASSALGIFISTLSQQSLLAALITLMLLAFLWMLGTQVHTNPAHFSLLHYLSLEPHFSQINRGLVSLPDVAYFVLFACCFFGLSVWRLHEEQRG